MTRDDLPESPPRPAADILSDPATSFWLRDALQTALLRDPGDAAIDAIILQEVLEQRFADLLGRSETEVP